MVILELVCQGVKGLPAAVRLALKPGYTILHAPAGGAAIWPLFDALCYADLRGTGQAQLVAPGASAARVGLIFQGRDGVTYRLVRDLGGPGALSRLEPASGKLLPVTQDAAEIGQYLRSNLGLPTRAAYESVFSLSAAQWPSLQAAVRPATGAIPAARPQTAAPARLASSFVASQAAATPVSDLPRAKSQLEALKSELEMTREVDAIQFQVDGQNRRIFELGAKVKELDQLQGELDAARAQAERVPSLESQGLPANVGERAAMMENLERFRDEQLRKIDFEREQFLGREHKVAPLYKDRNFFIGLGLGAASLGLGLGLGHIGRYLALLDIPSFGFAALVALRWVGELQAQEGVARRRSHYDERAKKVIDNFENEVLSVKTAMKLLKVESPEELVEALGKRQVLDVRVREVQAKLAALQADPQYARAREEVAQAAAEAQAGEAKLTQLGNYNRPVHQIENEIGQLEASIAAAENPSRAPIAAIMSSGLEVAAGGAEDPCAALLTRTSDLFQLDVPGLGQLIAPRAAQYLTALSDRRFVAVGFDQSGLAAVTSPAGRVAGALLDVRDRDLLYLAVKLTLMEKFSERQKLPLFFDDPLIGLDANKIALIGRMLKQLGGKTQVLHVSQSTLTQPLADSMFTLA